MSKVSIIVPVHNTERYLRATVKSLVEQTLKDIEIILVENASTDGSLALCHELAKTDDRIKVISLQKGDLSHARNNGLKLATSEYVAFVDSDDEVLPDMYETLYSVALEHDLDMMYCNHVMVYDDRPPRYLLPEDGTLHIMSSKEALSLHFTGRMDTTACSMLMRKSLFDNLNFPEDMYFEDRAFTFLLVDASRKVGYIKKAFYRYYQRSGSICHAMDWKRYYDFADAESRRLSYLNDSQIFSDEEKAELAAKAADSMLRRLRHLYVEAKTERQKSMTLDMTKNIYLIPKGCRLPLKARLIRWYLRTFHL